jgi:hypothetical protein
VQAILTEVGVLDGAAPQVPARFVRRNGDTDTVTMQAGITGEGRPGPDNPVLLQVSRWDRLKDMAGVMRGFADHVVPGGGGYLILAGPAVSDVADDPEGAAVYGECLLQWRDLTPAARARILLVTLPLDDIDENAAMVNALQRHATVIAQKSLAEGFGLTVSEGMWKGRPVIGSAVGGIIDQIADGTGILLPDPTDLKAFGQAVRLLFADQARATQMGLAARAYVRENFVGDIHLMRYAKLLGTLLFEDLFTPSGPAPPMGEGRRPRKGRRPRPRSDQRPADGSSGGLSAGAATWPARSRCALRKAYTMTPARTTTSAWYTAAYPAAKVTHIENSAPAPAMVRSLASAQPCTRRRLETR